MNEQKLIQNVIEQIKEAQLKLGAEKEVIRLYFPMASMNAILGTNYTDETGDACGAQNKYSF